jgi:hypothetical protein
MYKLNNGYSMTNCGAPEVDCPLCAGKGTIDDEAKAVVKRKRKAKLVDANEDKTSEL